jgi:hypothetical protein
VPIPRSTNNRRAASSRAKPGLIEETPQRAEESPVAMASAMSDPCELFVCTTMVYIGAMATSKQVRRSVTLPAQVVRQIERIAKRRRLSDNRVLVELIEEGIEARQQKEKAFFELAEKFRAANDPDQVKQLGDQLGQFVFGE